MTKKKYKERRVKTQLKKWVFTLHLNRKDKQANKKAFKEILEKKFPGKQFLKKSLVCLERGKRANKPHLQGFFVFNRGIDLFRCKKEGYLPESIHLEYMKGSLEDNINYVAGVYKPWEQKQKIFYSHGLYKHQIPEKKEDRSFIKIKDFYGYQKFIWNIINEDPDPRFIYWFYDSGGKTGKSCFTKTLVRMGEAFYLGDTGTVSDMAFAIRTAMTLKNGKVDFKKYPKTFVLDLSRAKENKVSYSHIQRVKNGLFFSPKYESNYVISHDFSHIICFANYPPKINKLSLDRWKIFHLKKIFMMKNFSSSKELLDIVQIEGFEPKN